MYHHVKKLMYTVRVDEPDPRFGNMLLEQFGGANGELAAAMQYSIQGLNCEDAERKDLLMDIGTEELSHLEIVGGLARMHLKPMKFARDEAEADPLIAIAGGGGVNLFNSMGNPWTADYLKITGELDVDLRSNIAAEARAKIVYERLINFCNDAGTKDALQFLMTREITHMRAFTAALESLGKPPFAIGRIAPTSRLVDQFFNDSTGEGDHGEIDSRGPWNEGEPWEFVEAPAFQDFRGSLPESPPIHAESSDLAEPDSIEELLIEQLRDILHAEKQLLKALPKMAKAARSVQLQRLFEIHLEETEAQVERLNECFGILGTAARAKPCKGMMGLVEELLIEQLRDILHAEKQLLKALPKMAKAARSVQLRRLFEIHLEETEAQVERLNECFGILGTAARAKPCKGMMGLVEEGEEVIAESKKKDDAAADLALIAAAQRVEHYEVAGYTTARNLAQQLHHSAIVQHLSKSLAEEENADQLLDQVSRPLMSAAKMPAAVE